jgi:hypothetical protein
MISRIHGKLGTAGFIISIVALVAALGGGAYAASGGLTGKQKKEVEKIAKKYAGKPGATGAAGPAGPAGAKGDVGAAGAAGTDGTNGTNGTNGTDGLSGFTETLPSDETETGTFSIEPIEEEGSARLAISFPIPLGTPVTAHLLNQEDPATAECPGSSAEPVASPGNLCVYETDNGGEAQEYTLTAWINPESGSIAATTTGKVGTTMFLSGVAGPLRGDWAVTAP